MVNALNGDWGGGGRENTLGWHSPIEYQCGFCGRQVASERGWICFNSKTTNPGDVRICPNCNRPTFFEGDNCYPSVPIGEPIKHLPREVEALYNEARTSAGAGAPTAAVLALRKLLMNVAVNKGAKQDQSFEYFVGFLSDQGYVPKDGKHWVDHIRSMGNEANHQIKMMNPADAEQLIAFAGMLLKLVYEFPSSLPKVTAKP